MTPILNELDTHYYYEALSQTVQSEGVEREKMRQLNNAFLSLLNLLTEQKERQIFTGWFAKISFLAQAYGLGNEREQSLQSMRRLLRRSVISLKYLPTEAHYLTCLKIITNLVHHFSGIAIPENIARAYQNTVIAPLIFRDIPQDVIPYLYATIVGKGKREIDASGVGKIRLDCDTEDFGAITLTVQDVIYYKPEDGSIIQSYDLSNHCQVMVRPHNLICITNLEKLEDAHFATTTESLLVLTPDYLVDASAIAKCFLETGKRSAYFYFLNKIKFFQGSSHTFLGNVVNQMLDKLVETPKATFDQMYQEIWGEMQMEAALIKLSNADISQIQSQAKEQFTTLQKEIKRYEGKTITTEPTFITNRYGLQGRIDLLVEYPEQPKRKDIVELKSTSYPNAQMQAAKIEHLVQVACYNMLIDSTFEGRNGVSSVLYSKDTFTALRDCGKLNFERQRASHIRNCIVYLDWEIAKGETKIYDTIIQRLESLDVPPYIKQDVLAFKDRWINANALDKQYYASQMGLVTREMQVAKVGAVSGNEPSQGFSGLWRNDTKEKQDNFSILFPLSLEVEKSHFERGELCFLRAANEDVTAFRAGDIILLYPVEEQQKHSPQHYQLLKGNILEIHPNRVIVKIWNKALDQQFFKNFQQWAVEPNLMESGYNHQFASLSEFLGAPLHKKSLIYGLERPSFEDDFSVDYTHTLSQEQNRILNKALATKDYFLLQGPPGTGKTSKMLRNMVHHLYHSTKQKVVLLAFTNRATDEICQKIDDVCEGNYIRLGNIDELSNFRQKSLKDLKDLEQIRLAIDQTRIFVSTVASFYRYIDLLGNMDTLIVDEASQLLEPALVGILPRFERFILVGDEKQLPAVVTQPMRFCAVDEPALNSIGITDLSISLFERLLLNAQENHWHDCYEMLDTQYRTHQDIAGFISKEFYKTLKIGSPIQAQSFNCFSSDSADIIEQKLAQGRLQFWASEPEKTMKFHQQEAKTVVAILNTIRNVYGKNFNHETVGVITPYKAQMAEILKQLDDELRYMVSVDTVERYQGSERDIIIISMAVNHPSQMRNLQALNQAKTTDKKLNVALSRAREQLIMLGNPKVLKEGIFYKKFLEKLGL